MRRQFAEAIFYVNSATLGNKKLPRFKNLNYHARMYITTLLLTISCLVSPAHAREPIDLSLDVTTKAGASKQEAFDQATEDATRKTAEDLVGSDKLGPVWPQIKNKLLKNTARYVLFIRGSAASETPEGSKTTVQMRLSPDGLETLLREFGVFNGASVRVLPLIAVTEPQGTRYVWWSESTDPRLATAAQEYFKRTIQQLNASARGKSIYIMDPLNPSLRAGIPASYRTETLRHEDQLLLARYLKADVVLSGRVEVVRSAQGPQLNLNFEMWQARNGHSIAESQRAEPLPGELLKVVAQAVDQSAKRSFTDLSARLGDAASGGAFNLNTLKLAVTGVLNYRQQADLKKVLGELREIRSLRDRLFEPGRVVYEIESPATGPELVRVLRAASLRGFAAAASESGEDGVILNVRPVPTGG